MNHLESPTSTGLSAKHRKEWNEYQQHKHLRDSGCYENSPALWDALGAQYVRDFKDEYRPTWVPLNTM